MPGGLRESSHAPKLDFHETVEHSAGYVSKWGVRVRDRFRERGGEVSYNISGGT